MRKRSYPEKEFDEELSDEDEAELEEDVSKFTPESEDEKLVEDDSWLEDEAELDEDELDWKVKVCPGATWGSLFWRSW